MKRIGGFPQRNTRKKKAARRDKGENLLLTYIRRKKQGREILCRGIPGPDKKGRRWRESKS